MSERRLRLLSVLLAQYARGQEGTPAEHLRASMEYVNGSLQAAQDKVKNLDSAEWPEESGQDLRRELILVEVLSEGGTGDADLADLAEQITVGLWSGEVDSILEEKVGPRLMSGLLIEQRSDPEFLLAEED